MKAGFSENDNNYLSSTVFFFIILFVGFLLGFGIHKKLYVDDDHDHHHKNKVQIKFIYQDFQNSKEETHTVVDSIVVKSSSSDGHSVFLYKDSVCSLVFVENYKVVYIQ